MISLGLTVQNSKECDADLIWRLILAGHEMMAKRRRCMVPWPKIGAVQGGSYRAEQAVCWVIFTVQGGRQGDVSRHTRDI